MLTHGSLFSGIGGFDLGFERAGIETIWQVENDPYAVKVLEKHWPDVKRYGDIREIEWEGVEVPDIISGGFPCQPVSVAGKRRGQADERWLWPEFARCLRVLRPRYAVLENVPGILALGFGDVLGDLAALGYDAEWQRISAAAFGAPHLRKRLWIVAYAASDLRRTSGDSRSTPFNGCGSNVPHSRRGGRGTGERNVLPGEPDAVRSGKGVADAEGNAERPGLCEGEPRAKRGRRLGDGDGAIPHPPGPRLEGQKSTRFIFGRRRGLPAKCDWWATEPNVGRVAYGIPARVDRLKCLGNAIVPQVAEWLGRRIVEFDE